MRAWLVLLLVVGLTTAVFAQDEDAEAGTEADDDAEGVTVGGEAAGEDAEDAGGDAPGGEGEGEAGAGDDAAGDDDDNGACSVSLSLGLTIAAVTLAHHL